jgi:hypothetical protein
MECACTYDKGAVTDMCGAHAELTRRESKLAREAEREACAKVADAWAAEIGGTAGMKSIAQGIAMEIRARK